VIVDLSSPGGEEIELLRAVDRMCREHATPLVAAARPGDHPPAELPHWRTDDAPTALQALLEVASEPAAARLVTPAPLR